MKDGKPKITRGCNVAYNLQTVQYIFNLTVHIGYEGSAASDMCIRVPLRISNDPGGPVQVFTEKRERNLNLKLKGRVWQF